MVTFGFLSFGGGVGVKVEHLHGLLIVLDVVHEVVTHRASVSGEIADDPEMVVVHINSFTLLSVSFVNFILVLLWFLFGRAQKPSPTNSLCGRRDPPLQIRYAGG